MLRLSKKTDYALMAMTHLARATPGASASAREIALEFDIPHELMAKVLQKLARRGLLASQHGTRGGYHLARAAEAISVAQVIEAIDGPLAVTACSTGHETCDQYSKCNVRDPLFRIKDRILQSLQLVRISELANDEEPAVPVSLGGRRAEPALASGKAR
jgi:Rrf2 family protein